MSASSLIGPSFTLRHGRTRPPSAAPPIVVQKFGGTLLRSPVERERVVEQIRQSRASGRRIIVVASAMGRAGEPYATDTLLRLASDIDPHVDPRTQDLLISCGEIISTALLAHVLAQAGFRSLALTGAEAGIVTDDQFGAANIMSIQPLRVLRALRDGLIPVIAGFQGRTSGGDMTTLGRGGSDITAVALAAAVGGHVEIFKDVEGMMTADPRVVPAARTIPRMTYADASQAGWLGARVLHPRAAELAREYQVRLTVRPLLGGAASGTEFVPDDAACGRSIVVVHSSEFDGGRVSVMGSGLRDRVDGSRLARQALQEAGVPVMAEARDRRRSTFSCTVPVDSLEAAARTLHSVFVEGHALSQPIPAGLQLQHAS
jgi:aspartate kinase